MKCKVRNIGSDIKITFLFHLVGPFMRLVIIPKRSLYNDSMLLVNNLLMSTVKGLAKRDIKSRPPRLEFNAPPSSTYTSPSK